MLKIHRPFTWLLTCVLFHFTNLTIIAQNPAATPAAKSTAGRESCAGALDIVPSKSASFVRKRRPNNKKPAHKSENKNEIKSAG